MTAPDPRLGEIEGRLATPKAVTDAQFGDVLRIIWATYYFGADLQWHNARTGHVEQAETLVEEIQAAAGDWGWLDGRRDVAYLLAELRKRDEALRRVEALHRLEFTDSGEGDGLGYWNCDECAYEADNENDTCPTMAAVAAATGGGDRG